MQPQYCALCAGEMVRGRIAIIKNSLARLFWPWASDRIIFHPDRGYVQ